MGGNGGKLTVDMVVNWVVCSGTRCCIGGGGRRYLVSAVFGVGPQCSDICGGW